MCSMFKPEENVQKKTVTTMNEEKRYNMYSREANEGRRITKRAASITNARTCTLFLQSDTMLWDYVTKPLASGGMGYVSWIISSIVVLFNIGYVCNITY